MNAAARLKEIQDKVNESLQYSIDNLAALMDEESERLFDIRTRREAVRKEHEEVLAAAEKAERVPSGKADPAERRPVGG